jgi:aryl-alcohol dehydrogenase-like predicted oxidoreductase
MEQREIGADVSYPVETAINDLHRGLIPYFPLASGWVTGKYKRGVGPPHGTRLNAWKQRSSSLLTDQKFDKVEPLEAYAGAQAATGKLTATQVSEVERLAPAWRRHELYGERTR